MPSAGKIQGKFSHPGENPRPRWGMKMVKTYSTTFKRLLGELVHIKYLAKDPNIELLNKRCGGYQGYVIPRLSVWDGDKEDGHSAQTQVTDTSNNEDQDSTARVNKFHSITLKAKKWAIPRVMHDYSSHLTCDFLSSYVSDKKQSELI